MTLEMILPFGGWKKLLGLYTRRPSTPASHLASQPVIACFRSVSCEMAPFTSGEGRELVGVGRKVRDRQCRGGVNGFVNVCGGNG